MDNLIFSLNATVPVFLIILLGYILKRLGLINENFIKTANKINFTITLPVLLFRDLINNDVTSNFDIIYLFYCMIVTTVMFWGIWGLTKLFMKDKSMIGAFVQASFRGSVAVLGIALVQNIYGNSGAMPLVIIGAVPLFNIYSVIVLTFESSGPRAKTIKNAIIDICRNPIIIAILLGMIVSWVKIDFPGIVDTSIDLVARMATPFALLCVGGGFEVTKAISKIKPTIVASLIKLFLLPVLFVPVAIILGFREGELAAAILMLGAPSTPTCYIMAKQMHNDGTLSSSIIVMTTLLSAFSLTAIIYILKSFGYL